MLSVENKQPHHVNPPVVSPLGSVVTIPEMFINYGDNVTLECKAGGGPGNVYQWEHDGVTIAGESTSYLIVNSSLVDPTDLGTYTCIVSNAAGYGRASSVVHGKTLHTEHGCAYCHDITQNHVYISAWMLNQ